ncbi:MAG: ABC transporter permease [Anaerovoracaceae bacterium]|jgi:teichoic acid transport system permease protein
MKELANIIREHIAWRPQILHLAWTDLKKTFSGAALGWSWALIKPGVTIFVYWFAFSSGLRHHAGIEGFPFFLWMMAGIIPWFYIREMLNKGTNAMRRYKHLITKMKFPVSTIPTFISLAEMMVHLFLLAITLVLFICWGYTPNRYWIQLPLYLFLMFLFCTGWALFGSVLAAMSQDFLNLVRSFTMALFWLSCIMFPITNIRSQTIVRVMKCNPVTFTVEGYRNCLVHGTWFFEDLSWLAVYLIELVIIWVLAVWTFHRMKREMPDVL